MADSAVISKQEKYRASQKYRDWLSIYMQKNKARLNENTKKWRSKPENVDSANKKQVEYRRELKKRIYSVYGNRCNCCGEANPIFLTIDHVNNDGYLFKDSSGKRKSGRALYNKIVSENYPSTYQLLCMNCNFGKSLNGGICPHRLEENG